MPLLDCTIRMSCSCTGSVVIRDHIPHSSDETVASLGCPAGQAVHITVLCSTSPDASAHAPSVQYQPVKGETAEALSKMYTSCVLPATCAVLAARVVQAFVHQVWLCACVSHNLRHQLKLILVCPSKTSSAKTCTIDNHSHPRRSVHHLHCKQQDCLAQFCCLPSAAQLCCAVFFSNMPRFCPSHTVLNYIVVYLGNFYIIIFTADMLTSTLLIC